MNDPLKFRPDKTENGELHFGETPKNAIAPDCRYYHGDRPCKCNQLCRGCQQYAPYTQRICIIKLGALGDVIRTLCILPTLREQYPDAQITWVSKPNGCRMIQPHPMIDRVLEFDPINNSILVQEQFDLIINLDKEPQPCALAMAMFAKEKRGIGLSRFGTPIPLNREAEHYFNLGLCDDLKFNRNSKSYPQLVHEALGFEYRGQRYELPVDALRRQQFQTLLQFKGWKPNRLTIGINVGAGRSFANKMVTAKTIIQLIRQLKFNNSELQFLLLGGPDEREKIDEIINQLQDTVFASCIFDAGTDHDEPSFVALVALCDVLLTGDTMAMHVAVATGRHIVAFFGPTCDQEIDLFGKGSKIIAHASCSPCYKSVCDQRDVCIKNFTNERFVSAIEQQLLIVGLQRGFDIHQPVRKAV